MATKSNFTKAIRYTYFNITHTTTFDGSETVHVKTNLTASVDGDYALTADAIALNGAVTLNSELDLGQQKIVNAENVIRSVKKSITYADFSATSREFPEVVTIFRASPGDTIVDMVANLTASFGLSTEKWNEIAQKTFVSVGDLGATGGFGRTKVLATPIAWQWGTDNAANKGEYLRSVTGSILRKTYLTATLVKANFVASDIWLASIDTGSIDIYIDVLSRS